MPVAVQGWWRAHHCRQSIEPIVQQENVRHLRAYKDWAVEGRGQDPAILSRDSVEGREPVTSQIWPEFTVRSFPTLKDGEFQHLSTCEFVPRPFQ